MNLQKIFENSLEENKKYYMFSFDVSFDLEVSPNDIMLYTKSRIIFDIKKLNLKIEKISLEENCILINDFLMIKELYEV